MSKSKFNLSTRINETLLTITSKAVSEDPKKQEKANERKREKVESLLFKHITESYKQPVSRGFSTLPTDKKLQELRTFFVPMHEQTYIDMIDNIKDYVFENSIEVGTFDDLIAASEQWHELLAERANNETTDVLVSPENETLIVQCRDENFRWVNLNADYSEFEAKHMGHCGRDSSKLLFSLRDKNNKPHVTVSYSVAERALYQIKGRGNTKPSSIYHKNILDLIMNETIVINQLLTGGYKHELDFNLTDLPEEVRHDLYKKKPSIEFTNSVYDEYFTNKHFDKCIILLINGFDYTGSSFVSLKENREDAETILKIVEETDIAGKQVMTNDVKGRIITNLIRYDEDLSEEEEIKIAGYFDAYMRSLDESVLPEVLKKLMLKNIREVIKEEGDDSDTPDFKNSPIIVRAVKGVEYYEKAKQSLIANIEQLQFETETEEA